MAIHKLYELAQTFHALEECPTGEKFDAAAFAKWAGDRNMGDGGVWAALFVLSVWNDKPDYAAAGLGMRVRYAGGHKQDNGVGRFYMHDALGAWDHLHRAAFAAWTVNPWWC